MRTQARPGAGVSWQMLSIVPAQEAPRATHKGADTRQHIIRASMPLFSEKGFGGTTVRDIARAVGITDAAIYYHFRTKEELLHALLITELESRPERRCHRDASPEDALRSIAREAAALIDANQDLLVILLREGVAGDCAAIERYRELIDGWERRLVARLSPFEESGALPKGSAESLACQVVCAVATAFLDLLLPRCAPELTPAERRRQVDATLRRRLRSFMPPGAFARSTRVAPTKS